ncbi:MAG: hypothetical protein Q9178_001030 [Gyalolechia marmorata]
MDGLPSETIPHIGHALSHASWKWESATVDLQSLRLCSRKLAWLAAEVLVVEILLFMDQDSLRKSSAIAEYPIYKDKVRPVEIFGTMVSTNLNVKEEYEHDIRAISVCAHRKGPSWTRMVTQGFDFLDYAPKLQELLSFYRMLFSIRQAS